MRNAIKRITHKERAQPAHRKKLGLLEKHKDYVERAKHYHKKKDYMNVLKKKAAERNPDEFYFKMNSSEVSKGVHRDLDSGSLDTETVKLLKTQDLGYLVHKASIDLKKAEKLQNNLHLIGDRKPREHKLFVEDKSEVDEFNVASRFDTVPELADRTYNRPRVKDIERGVIIGGKTTKDVKKAQKLTAKSYDELNKRIKRAERLKKAAKCVQLQKNLMGKGSKRKIVDGNDSKSGVPVFKWKRQRTK